MQDIHLATKGIPAIEEELSKLTSYGSHATGHLWQQAYRSFDAFVLMLDMIEQRPPKIRLELQPLLNLMHEELRRVEEKLEEPISYGDSKALDDEIERRSEALDYLAHAKIMGLTVLMNLSTALNATHPLDPSA